MLKVEKSHEFLWSNILGMDKDITSRWEGKRRLDNYIGGKKVNLKQARLKSHRVKTRKTRRKGGSRRDWKSIRKHRSGENIWADVSHVFQAKTICLQKRDGGRIKVISHRHAKRGAMVDFKIKN